MEVYLAAVELERDCQAALLEGYRAGKELSESAKAGTSQQSGEGGGAYASEYILRCAGVSTRG